MDNVSKIVSLILNQNPEIRLSGLYVNYKQTCGVDKINKNEKNEIRKIYNKFNDYSLRYNRSKKESCQIKDFHPILKRLIKVHKLDVNKDSHIVLLTSENANKIEAIINEDDDYFPFSYEIYKALIHSNKDLNRNKLIPIVREIDRDNSTNVWRYNPRSKEFYNVIEFMSNRKTNFFGQLEEGVVNLPDKIVEVGTNAFKSLSSKICKYLCQFYCGKDNYYINDKYVRHVLLFYFDFYKIPHNEVKDTEIDNLSYEQLHNMLELLRNKVNIIEKNAKPLSKHELDHILWYCYKCYKS